MSAGDRPKTDVVTPTREAPVKLKLVVVDGPDFGKEFSLDPGSYRLGKDAVCEIVLQDPAISRVHLTLSVKTAGIELRDEHSTNGSSCNGARFEVVVAREGALIEVGRSTLKLVPQSQRVSPLPPSTATAFGTLVGQSLVMRQLFAVLERVASSDSDLLIQGETGTGKELCARSLHAQSRRKDGPFVVCDLSSISRSLIESELFGHLKGSFTGASADRRGVFQQAHGGTVFLDEVGELPLDNQSLLLRVLERREIKRIGDGAYRPVDVRVIAASHRDLAQGVTRGSFRQDLYHRLAGVEVTLPPLRDRPEDIPFLIDHILKELGKAPTLLDAQTRALMSQHVWPGNVRELRNVIERAITLGVHVVESAVEGAGPGSLEGGGASVPFKEAKERLVEAFERNYLAQMLQRCDWNLSRAARESGIDRFYVRQLMKKHGLRKP